MTLLAQKTADLILAGDVRAAARLMRAVDDDLPGAVEVLKRLFPHTGRAWVLGFTGSPGVGKSTLTDAVIGAYRAQHQSVGVVAVDPTSPFTGGAILGDRIRMQRHATDEGVFIRSLATRGQFGGLTASTRGVVTIMDAMGKDLVLVETVGVGQDEVDIVRMADTTVIVVVPGLGDDIQAIKAGILEAGDIFVVNKMDREGAGRTAAELQAMIAMRGRKEGAPETWTPPVLMTCASDGRGVDELIQAVAAHRAVLQAEGGRLLKERRRARARMEILELVKNRAMTILLRRLENGQSLDLLAGQVACLERDPYSVVEEIMAHAALHD
ncbi:MAG: methylmalonyl Co-A mutase-associated GTPase MeaB [Desulfarculus sp.]|nr:methylmalonyl Co-A mutase-associated GTPase MeaB [Desulfarculus sp.]